MQGNEFVVLVNGEGQYSLWPADMSVPAGWDAQGPAASRDACLARIRECWTDMRPASLRAGLTPSARTNQG